MITHDEASLVMDMSLKRCESFMKREGFVFPALYLLNKEPIEIELEHQSVINVDSDTECEELGICKSIVAFKMSSKEDELMIQEIANQLVRQHNPDACALTMQCLYKEVPGHIRKTIKSLQLDPDVIRILHGCYWLREDPVAMMSMTPYVNRGEIKDAAFSDSDDKFDVMFMRMGWMRPLSKIGAKLNDPYTRS